MKTFLTLIKLQKTFVDEQRLHVAALQDHLERIENDITQLEILKAREQVAATDVEARATFGAYLTKIVARGRAMEHERQAAEMAVKIARDKLAELFEEQKRYEIAEQQRVEAKRRETERREKIDLDEIGSVMHERNKV